VCPITIKSPFVFCLPSIPNPIPLGTKLPIIDSRLIAFRQLLSFPLSYLGVVDHRRAVHGPRDSPYLSRIPLLFLSSTFSFALRSALISYSLCSFFFSLNSCRSSVIMSSISSLAMLRATTSSSLHPDPSLSSSTAYKLSDTHIK
jgi:hypothetical protein